VKPRHAAALALVVWYLMVPPDSAKAPHYADTEAPLARWTGREDYFDTLKSCEKTLAELQNNERDKELIWASSKCIASDDPRLKSK
jgi:hypothetical protein